LAGTYQWTARMSKLSVEPPSETRETEAISSDIVSAAVSFGNSSSRRCRAETEKRLSDCVDKESSDEDSDSQPILKKPFRKPPVDKEAKKKTKIIGKVESVDALPDIEVKCRENMIRNAEIMRSLGLEIAAEAVRETPQKKQTAKVPKAAEDETSWNGSNDGSSDEESPKKRKPAPPGTEANRPGRSCKKARASTAPPQPLTFGSELEGRRLRVHFHTEDVGGMVCHHGDILRHRRRRGKDEHLVRWDTEGAEDEWLCLAEEEH